MMGIGFTEMLVIGILILLLFGPDKIPAVARTLAKLYREIRTTGAEFTRAVRTEIDAATGDSREELRRAQTDLTAAASGLLAGRFGDTTPSGVSVNPTAPPLAMAAARAVGTSAQPPVPPEWLETIEMPYPAARDTTEA